MPGAVLKAIVPAAILATLYVWSLCAGTKFDRGSFDSIALTGDGTETFPVRLETASWMFNAVHNTMRILGNNWARNGFSFVPGYVPAGTLLYHGKRGARIPEGMEWLAFDAEYSFNMLSGPFSSSNDSYLFTFTNSEPLKILNIDGASAALYPEGTMDSQGLVLNMTKDDWVGFKEYERANLLCAMGKNYGIDGYVRLNTGFELVMCSFQNPKLKLVTGVQVPPVASSDEDDNEDDDFMSEIHSKVLDDISAARSGQHCVAANNPEVKAESQRPLVLEEPSNLMEQVSQDPADHPPGSGPSSPPRPLPRKRPRGSKSIGWDWILSGVNHFYGDPRVIPDYRGFITAYGRDNFEVEGPIYTHRLLDAPEELQIELRNDILAVLSVYEPALEAEAINWRTVTDEIVGKFVPILTSLNYTFSTLGEDQDVEKIKKTVQDMTSSFVRRFTDVTLNETTSSSGSLERCAASWDPTVTKAIKLTTLEKRILSSVRTVTRELCGFVYDTYNWSSAVTPLTADSSIQTDLGPRLHSLIDTLGWVDFLECKTKCEAGQVCYFPMWPGSWIKDEDYTVGLRCVSKDELFNWH